jgi:hypothetical protein
MPDPTPFADRLRKGILRVDQQPPGGTDAEAFVPFRRSLERTLVRVTAQNPRTATFRFQLTGGKPLLLQGNEALPLEPSRLAQLLNTIGLVLQPGETLDLDGAMAIWLIRMEVNVTDTHLRQADLILKGMKTGRDRDHAAAQVAESAKIRLRSRLTQLVGAIQAAQKDAEMPRQAVPLEAPKAPAPPPESIPAKAPPPAAVLPPEPPPPEPPPKAPLPEVPALPPPSAELLATALRKILAAIEGSGVKAVAVGEIGHQVWGSRQAARRVELLLSSGELQRETILGAARGEGLQQMPGAGPLNLQFTDPRLGGTTVVDLVETVTPFHKKVFTRAQPGVFLEVRVRVATCEDLILLRAGSPLPADRESVIELLRLNGAGIDAAYLKETAKATGVFDQLKSTWQQAKQQA